MKLNNPLLGTSAMAAASALRIGMQIVILPVIGRFLGPVAYGEIALVSPFIFFAMLLSESGLGACIMRAEIVTKELQGTVLCFSLGISVAIMAVFALLAYPVGLLIHEPRFPVLLIGMSTLLLFAAVQIVPSALLVRAKHYDVIAMGDVASSLASLAGVGVGIALGWGVWSLVAQQISLWTVKTIVPIITTHWRPCFIFSRKILREQIAFGSRLTGSSVLTFIAANIDNVLIGALMGAEVLGTYALAYQIVGLPSMILSGSVFFTIMSGASEAQRQGSSSLALFLTVMRAALMLGLPTIVGLAVTAPVSVPLLLGDKWGPTVMLVVLLAPLGLQQMITAMTGGVIIGLGRSDLVLRLGIINSALTIAAIVAGAFISSKAVAIGVSTTALMMSALHLKTVAVEYGARLGEIMKPMMPPLIASMLMGGVVYISQVLLGASLPLAIQLSVEILIGVIAYAVIFLCLFRDPIAADIAALRATLFAKRAALEEKAVP